MRDDVVYMRTTRGPQRVDVIYRRLDDDFIDPLAFRPEIRARRAGVAHGLSRGTRHHRERYRHGRRGRQIDLSVCAGHGPVLPRRRAAARRTCRPGCCGGQTIWRTCSRICRELVVKEVHGAGGYGMLIGPASTRAQIEDFRKRIIANPERYIAQPTLALSTSPTFVAAGHRSASHRPATVRAVRQGDHRGAGRTHARRASRRLARREFLARRRNQRHLGAGKLTHAEPHR